MASFALLASVFLFQFVLLLIACTWTARRLRAVHSSWRRGAAITAAIVGLNLLTSLALLVPARLPAVLFMAAALVLVTFLTVTFVIIRHGFGLPGGRAAAVLGVVVICFVAMPVLSIFIVKPHAVETFTIPTNSMRPTIDAGDYLAACKLLTPRRWECVVYHAASGQVFCKRLAGLPGEKLRFEGGNFYVNDVQAVAPVALAGRMHATNGVVPGLYHDGESITLFADECFLIGDNVDASLDSRYEGPSPRDSLIGVVDLRYWPAGRIGLLR